MKMFDFTDLTARVEIALSVFFPSLQTARLDSRWLNIGVHDAQYFSGMFPHRQSQEDRQV